MIISAAPVTPLKVMSPGARLVMTLSNVNVNDWVVTVAEPPFWATLMKLTFVAAGVPKIVTVFGEPVMLYPVLETATVRLPPEVTPLRPRV